MPWPRQFAMPIAQRQKKSCTKSPQSLECRHMIAQLRGQLSNKHTDHIIIDVGGVGYHVLISLTTYDGLPELDATIKVFIHTHVREDQITLFGFLTVEEKMIFQRLLTVSGVGPKLALTILSGMAPHDVIQAVTQEDLARLCALPGVGKKTAERILVDLRDKLIKEHGLLAPPPAALKKRPPSISEDAISALINLGYSRQAAEQALSGIAIEESNSLQYIIKQALRDIGRL